MPVAAARSIIGQFPGRSGGQFGIVLEVVLKLFWCRFEVGFGHILGDS